MTKKLEDILNLPNVKEAFKEVDKKEQAKANKDQTKEVMKNVDPETRKNLEKMKADQWQLEPQWQLQDGGVDINWVCVPD